MIFFIKGSEIGHCEVEGDEALKKIEDKGEGMVDIGHSRKRASLFNKNNIFWNRLRD